MSCLICLEPIKDIGFECRVCVEGVICDGCFYNKFTESLPLHVFPMIMFKLIKCPICRSVSAEEYVDN